MAMLAPFGNGMKNKSSSISSPEVLSPCRLIRLLRDVAMDSSYVVIETIRYYHSCSRTVMFIIASF